MKCLLTILLLTVAAASHAGALSRSYQIIEMLNESGNVEQAMSITTYCSASAKDDELHYYKALLSHLAANTWQNIMPGAQAQVEEFGFAFSLEARRALVADFTVELLTGIKSDNIEDRILSSDELATLFPNTKIFRYLVQELNKIRKTLANRATVEAEVEAKSLEVAKMRARLKDASGRANWEQDGFIKMTIAQEQLKTMRASMDGLEPVSLLLDGLIVTVRKHLAKAGASGEY
jgi:hypothetical protein